MQPHTAHNFCTTVFISQVRCHQGRSHYFELQNPIKKTGHTSIAKENLNILSMLINYKHYHLTYFMQKVITSVHSVNNQYTTIWGYFSKVKACQRL
jgi:hypothetical protein